MQRNLISFNLLNDARTYIQLMYEFNLMKCLAVVQLYAELLVPVLNSTQIQITIKFIFKTILFLAKVIKSYKKLLKIDKQPISELSVAGK